MIGNKERKTAYEDEKNRNYGCLAFLHGNRFIVCPAYKVVEKSDKKAPVWYESAESGYIVASAETGSMEEARQQCPESVKRQIIQAVAQNVEFSDSHIVKQTSGNGDRITEFVDQHMAEGSTRAASLPLSRGSHFLKSMGRIGRNAVIRSPVK